MMSANALSSPVISSQAVIDLELIEGEQGPCVATALDRTITKAGKKELRQMLVSPTADVSVLKARQELISFLRKAEVRAAVERELITIAEHEEGLQRCFEQGFHEQTMNALKNNYFSTSFLKKYNRSPYALEINNLGQVGLIFVPLFEHFIFHSAMSKFLGTGCNHSHEHHHHHCSHHHVPSSSWKDAIRKTVVAGHFMFSLVSFYKMANDYWHRMGVVNRVHQGVVSINACVHAGLTIGDMVGKSSVAFADIETRSLLDRSGIDAILVGSSMYSSFAPKKKNNLQVISRVGPTLAAYTTALEQQEHIQQLLSATGSIDALLSIAKVLDEPVGHYNFVTLEEGTKPFVVLKDFVHPLLVTMDSVKNSVTFDGQHPSKMVITGPNKAGKSSVTKAIAVNCVLAQTFGIVAAASGAMVPLQRIITYINIRDNLSTDTSSFIAEIKRIDAVLKDLQALEGKGSSLCLFDDSLCRSTQSEAGEQLAVRFVKQLTEFASSIIFVVTHYEGLTKLEAETGGAIVNYRIGLYTGNGNKVSSSYLLEPGISPRDAIFSIVKQGTIAHELLA